LGVAVEVLESHLEGSKIFVYFTSKEETTGVTVVAKFIKNIIIVIVLIRVVPS
jgi:hypothetical protein